LKYARSLRVLENVRSLRRRRWYNLKQYARVSPC